MEQQDKGTLLSPWSHWGLPDRDLSDMKKAIHKEDMNFYCPYCGEKLPWMEEEGYEVDGNGYPQAFNEYLCGTPDGTIHDYDEVHCCPKCKKESYFRDGCF